MRLTNRLTRALSGAGGVLLIEGALGFGKSALLTELARDARTRGARLAMVAGRAHEAPLSACRALCVAADLPVPGAEEAEEAQLDALVRTLLSYAAEQPLVLVIDDAEYIDALSLEVVARLSRLSSSTRLLIALSANEDEAGSQLGLRPLRRSAMRLHLAPLTVDDLASLLRALFGALPALPRLAAFLAREQLESPLLALERIAMLLEQRQIHHAPEGWHVAETLVSGPPPTLAQVFERRLAKLSKQARTLAGCLSVRRLPVTRAQCDAIAAAELPRGAGTAALLRELTDARVLLPGLDCCIFSHGELQSHLHRHLPPEREQRVHALLARLLLPAAEHDLAVRAEVGCHLLLAGDEEAATPHLAGLVELVQDLPALLRAVPDLQVVQRRHEALPEARRNEPSVAAVPLLIAGLYVDPSIFDRTGMATLQRLETLSGVHTARRLSRFVGATLGLVLGIALAYVRWRFDRRPGKWRLFTHPLAYFALAVQLGAQALFRQDRALSATLELQLAPFRNVGARSIVRLVFDSVRAGGRLLTGRFTKARQLLETMERRVPRVRELDDNGRRSFRELGLFWRARAALLTGNGDSLALADTLRASPLRFHWLLAALLRHAHFLSRGELLLAEQARDQLDMLAARHGGSWAADLLSALEFPAHQAAGDVVGLKRCLDQLERLLPRHPAIATHVQVARAMYAARLGDPAHALALYAAIEADLEPFACALWSIAQGHWAECLNAVGQHDAARARCERMLRQAGPVARDYPLAFQQLERELGLALSGCGEHERAGQQLDALLARDGGRDQPLLVGLLHRDRALVALAAGDRALCDRQIRLLEQQLGAAHNPALTAQLRALTQRAGSDPPESSAVSSHIRLQTPLAGRASRRHALHHKR